MNFLDRNCSDDDHCGDFRMICSKVTKRCVCTQFYDWEPDIRQCNLNLTQLKEWLNNLGEERDFREELDEEALSIFYHLGLSGILAVSLGFLGAFVCVFLFCFQKPTEEDNQDKNPLTQSNQKNGADTEGEAISPAVVLDFDY
ncbi:hypothetical protein O3M35_011809 [Rhynocoris fuscipes]|uniref:Uncharacterized protein n=1 Tax=Rhynocoris fuscipes TaxID=488301 RepID=A0AAW1CXK7_9HEMI